MLKEILDLLSKVGNRRSLSLVSALAMASCMPGGGPLTDPFSVNALVLPFFVLFSSVLFVAWNMLLNRLNFIFRGDGQAGWEVGIGMVIISYCSCVVLWYVSKTPEPFTLKVISSKGFLWVFAAYLFAVETIKIERSYLR